MSGLIERRIATLEAAAPAHHEASAAEQHAAMVASAARCGLTEAGVMERFGGWPRFAYAHLMGEVVDPSTPSKPLVLPKGVSSMEAYFRLLGNPRGTSR